MEQDRITSGAGKELMEKEFLQKKVWAVVGANRNPDKYGNKILRILKQKGYEAYAVNPVYDSIDDERCYPDLSSLPRLPDVVNVVVSPERAARSLEEAARLGIKNIWFQPGTYDDAVIKLAEELGLDAVYACVLLAAKLYLKDV